MLMKLYIRNLMAMFIFDFASPGQILFQNPATPIMNGIIDLHHNIFFVMIAIFLLVGTLFGIITLEGNIKTVKELNKHHKHLVQGNEINHDYMLEIIWTVLPTIIIGILAVPSFGLLFAMDDAPQSELTIHVIGHQWYWQYASSLGLKKLFDFESYMVPTTDLVTGELRLLTVDKPLILPIRKHIRFLVSSEDVIHSFAVPSFGIKCDCVPGRLNQAFAYITRPGTYFGQCSEICGVNHAFMPIVISAK